MKRFGFLFLLLPLFNGSCDKSQEDARTCGALATLEKCIADQGCVWDPIVNTCWSKRVTSCADVKHDKACDAIGCIWDCTTCRSQSIFSGCSDYQCDEGCENAGCMWDFGKNTCDSIGYTTQCIDARNSTTCNNITGCEWLEDTCVSKNFSQCKDFKENACKAEATKTCVWDDIAKTCLSRKFSSCESYKNLELCAAVGCVSDGTTCLSPTSSCPSLNNETACQNISGCLWDPSGCKNYHNAWCESYTAKKSCEHKFNTLPAKCTWDGLDAINGTCRSIKNTLLCGTFKTAPSCEKAKCIWGGSYCLSPTANTCDAYTIESACKSHNCYWQSADVSRKETNGLCLSYRRSCSSFNRAKTCMDVNCFWNVLPSGKGFCKNWISSTCAYLKKDQCDPVKSGCYWEDIAFHINDGQCLGKKWQVCRDYDSKDGCLGDGCSWSPTQKKCFALQDAVCSDIGKHEPQTCAANSCRWSPNTDLCYSASLNCNLYTKDNCPIDIGCQIDPKSGSTTGEQICKSTKCTSVEFNQCISTSGCEWKVIDAGGQILPCPSFQGGQPGFCILSPDKR